MFELHTGDCLEVMKTLPDNSVDSVVTDPPAGICFMGKEWDSNKGGRDEWIKWLTLVMKETYRVLKPGGHMLVWALPRTSHWTGTSIENAGFEIRDRVHHLGSTDDKMTQFLETLNDDQASLLSTIFDESQFLHLFGQGFPKGQDIGKMIDKKLGARREVIGQYVSPEGTSGKSNHDERIGTSTRIGGLPDITAPATDAAKQWDGWNTTLKPAVEIWWLARKPLGEKTIADNVLKHGTGGVNIDGCRVSLAKDEDIEKLNARSGGKRGFSEGVNVYGDGEAKTGCDLSKGRHPSNLIHDGSEEVVGMFPNTNDVSSGGGMKRDGVNNNVYGHAHGHSQVKNVGFGDSGSAARFFYCAKTSKRDRNDGCDGLDEKNVSQEYGLKSSVDNREGRTQGERTNTSRANHHPTVKPTELMRYLCRLVTPPNGVVLDPFMGSGSTGKAAILEGFNFIGIEKEAEYIEIAKARIESVEKEK